jgi:RNA-directed DNA polymerase
VNTLKTAANPEKGTRRSAEGVELQERSGEPRRVSVSSRREAEINDMRINGLLEAILTAENLNTAYKRVKGNRGSHGVDGMGVDALLPYLKTHGTEIRQSLLVGTYRPQPVRRVEIPKPDGGVRLLGIPTVIDRMIQQAVCQILTPIFEESFSNHSYGFRPKRSAHDAVRQAQRYISEGNRTVVDMDLEKFFDRVNHDKLMSLVARRISDKRVLKLIRSYLESGVMSGGLVSATEEGTPQGGPLSPLLSNVMLDELDKELERRGHRFCRYADDCNIYVKSKRSGNRVMHSVTQFIEHRLKLRVNQEKSAVDSPTRRKFLGFSFYWKNGKIHLRVHPRRINRLKEKVREATSRRHSMSMGERIDRLNNVTRGWINYFRLADMLSHCQRLDEWTRRRLRMCYWKQWKGMTTKHDNLVRQGLPDRVAWQYANTRKGYWHTAKSPILLCTLTNDYFHRLGLLSFSEAYRAAS